MIQNFDGDAFETTLCNGCDDAFNNVNVGVVVLSESKGIMNRLFLLWRCRWDYYSLFCS
jgi:hypothetical protein